ncbi:MAG: rhomboid family intramembrane serine protease [Marinilabiliaceae bacterium]|nr:rhomboid family intramembrane serine protease [Marinilabiliaceae bacterium]
MIATLLGENLLWLLMVILVKPNTAAFKNIGNEKARKKELSEYKDFLKLFVPNKNFWAIPIIIDLNIIVFILMLYSGISIIHPQSNDLIAWGGNLRSLTTDGQWWRLLASVFVHGGLMHIGYNLFSLFLIGIFLESFVGSKRFMVIYLICGIVASIVSIYWYENTISVGASGAIFGMSGLVLALMLINYIDKGLLKFVLIFIGINLLIGLSGMIDMAAHLGGLITGFLIGLIYFPIEKFKKKL